MLFIHSADARKQNAKRTKEKKRSKRRMKSLTALEMGLFIFGPSIGVTRWNVFLKFGGQIEKYPINASQTSSDIRLMFK